MSNVVGIGCDHAGYALKQAIQQALEQSGFVVRDFGTHSAEAVDYPDFVHPLCQAMERGEFDRGILLCGSANGVSMTANKYHSIRAAVCWQPEIARLARRHNNANIICLPARFITDSEAVTMVLQFLTTVFEGGRHQRRVEKIVLRG